MAPLPTLYGLLVEAGIITALPCFIFSFAMQHLSLSMLGFTQYLASTMAFVLGVLVYHRPFEASRLVGLAAVWLALGPFVFDGFAGPIVQ